VHSTLFVLIILCIFVFNCLLFRIYSIEKNKKEKRKNGKQNLLPVESAVRSLKPPFQLAIAASQLAANHTGHAATVATYRQFKWR
jgi:hypothetical protein